VTVYSVEEADTATGSVSFITMELIEGRPLSVLIPKGGLDPVRLFELAIPAAEALSSAHALDEVLGAAIDRSAAR